MDIEPLKTIIVIPCYQEAARLDPDRFDEFIQRQNDVGFIFVDDHSTDNTANIIRQLVDRHPDRIASLINPVNMGKGASVRSGVLAAKGRAEYIGYWDADLSTPLDLIPEFVSTLRARSACLVMGSRIRIAGHAVTRKAWRHYPGRIFAAFASLIIGQGIYDTQCGAKLLTANMADACFTAPFLSRWCFDIEVVLRLAAHTRLDRINTLESEIIELPLTCWEDNGDTRLRFFDVFYMARDLWRIWYHYRFRAQH